LKAFHVKQGVLDTTNSNMSYDKKIHRRHGYYKHNYAQVSAQVSALARDQNDKEISNVEER
jgi:hypothetical protein